MSTIGTGCAAVTLTAQAYLQECPYRIETMTRAKQILFLIPLLILYACKQQVDTINSHSRFEVVTVKEEISEPISDIYPPSLHADGWYEPIPLSGGINTSGGEDSPYFDASRNALFFFFTPDTQIPATEQLNDGFTGIYVSYLVDETWSEAERVWLNDPKGATLDGCPTVSGNTLWFCSVREGNYRSIDIWKAIYQDGSWQRVENAGEILNVDIGIGEMDINADNTQIVFHSDVLGGEGKSDLWTTTLINGKWSSPQNLATINTEEDESRPSLSQDGSELWFTRTYQGSPAIYRSVWNGEEWGEAQLIISQFAGEPTLDPQGNIYFVHHLIQDGIILDADIYIAIKK